MTNSALDEPQRYEREAATGRTAYLPVHAPSRRKAPVNFINRMCQDMTADKIQLYKCYSTPGEALRARTGARAQALGHPRGHKGTGNESRGTKRGMA